MDALHRHALAARQLRRHSLTQQSHAMLCCTHMPCLPPASLYLLCVLQRWITFQLLHAVSQAHAHGVCHGDIKSENVMVTSWNWVLLTDFAPYKPTYLPADNPVRRRGWGFGAACGCSVLEGGVGLSVAAVGWRQSLQEQGRCCRANAAACDGRVCHRSHFHPGSQQAGWRLPPKLLPDTLPFPSLTAPAACSLPLHPPPHPQHTHTHTPLTVRRISPTTLTLVVGAAAT